LLALGSLGIGLLAAELAARLFLERPQSARIFAQRSFEERLAGENARPETMRMPVAMERRFIIETPTGFRLRANTVAVIESHRLCKEDIEVRTNSLGFRGPDVGEKSGTRVLFIGDSITLGDYLHEEDTFVRRVEGLFSDAGQEVQTINAGVGGIGLANELAVLLETGLRVDPDVVVVGFYLNDAMSSNGVEVLQIPAFLRWSRLLQHLAQRLPDVVQGERSETDKSMRRAWADEVATAFPPVEGDPLEDPAAFPSLMQEAWKDWGSAWSAGAWTRIVPVIEEFERQAELHDFELLFLCFPVRAQVEASFLFDHPQQRLARELKRLDIPLLDLLPLLREEQRSGAEELFYDQCHHTPHGNLRIAEWVHDFLKEHL
jgi:lysophospholipase L1-like esterase